MAPATGFPAASLSTPFHEAPTAAHVAEAASRTAIRQPPTRMDFPEQINIVGNYTCAPVAPASRRLVRVRPELIREGILPSHARARRPRDSRRDGDATW